MSEIDPYVAHASGRVVRMFQRYSQSINLDDTDFLKFITEYLAAHNIIDPKAVPYAELYKKIKEGIWEYLRQHESQAKTKTRT